MQPQAASALKSTLSTCQHHIWPLHRPSKALSRPHHLVSAATSHISPYVPDSSSDTSESSCDALDSEDFVYAAAPLRRAAALQYRSQQRQRQPPPSIHLAQLSLAAAEHCYPWIAAAYLAAAAGLLAVPQQAVQLFGAAAGSMGVADPLLVTFAQLLGATYLLQSAVALIAKGCAEHGQLHGTTCQRLLLASLLAMTGNIMSLGMVAFDAVSAAPAVWLGVLLATFAAHVACHLPHHPWFLVKVLWPVATTMVITDLLHLLPAVMAPGGGGLGAGRMQALLAALLSVKAISKLSRLAAGAAPRVAKRVLGPAASWLAKRSTRLLPLLAKRVGRAAPKITQIGGRLAGRMAPRYVKDQVTGRTMHMAFHDADAGMTQTVAKSIDLLPPKTPTAVFYTVLMMAQLAMIAAAYCPSLLYCLPPAAAEAAGVAAGVAGAAAAGGSVGEAAAVAAGVAGAAAAAAGGGAAEAVAAVGISDPVLRLVKYAFGSGFFVAAFACNCLKTAADRHHSWAPQNRQLAAALGVMQAVTAGVLFSGVRSGAVAAGPYAWGSIGLAAAGACVCCYQAATSSSTTQWVGTAPNSAAGSLLVLSHSMQGETQQQPVAMTAAGAAALSAAAAAEVCAAEQSVPLTSVECERRERSEPEYAAFTSAAVMVLTLLQLAL